jgi:hypothetical protein
MSLQVEYKESGNFVLAPAGLHQGVCCEVVDLGHSQKTYKDQKTGADTIRNVHEIQYYFQLNKVDPETGKRYEVRSKPMNLVLSEKATLRDFLRQWRGHDLTDAEKLPPGVDVEMIGRNAMINVIHAKVNEKTFANIGSITPLMDGLPQIQPLNYESKQAAADAKAGQNASNAFPYGQNDPNAPVTSFAQLDAQAEARRQQPQSQAPVTWQGAQPAFGPGSNNQ